MACSNASRMGHLRRPSWRPAAPEVKRFLVAGGPAFGYAFRGTVRAASLTLPGGPPMIAVRCPHCRHGWSTPPTDGPLACPVCGKAVVVTPAAAVETGFSLPLPSGNTSAGESCAPASVGEAHPFLSPPQGPGEVGRLGRYRVLRELGA